MTNAKSRCGLWAVVFVLFLSCAVNLLFLPFNKRHKYFLRSYDYLKITNDKAESFGKYCGVETGKTVYVTGDYAVITFHSDQSVERRGFQMFFTIVPPGKEIWTKEMLMVTIFKKQLRTIRQRLTDSVLLSVS